MSNAIPARRNPSAMPPAQLKSSRLITRSLQHDHRGSTVLGGGSTNLAPARYSVAVAGFVTFTAACARCFDIDLGRERHLRQRAVLESPFSVGGLRRVLDQRARQRAALV